MNKAVFLDRDGTINVDKDYLYRIEDFEFMPGAIEGLRKLQKAGYLLIVITNQSGIARGYYTEEDYKRVTEYMKQELEKRGVFLTDVLYCPHHPNAAIEKYRINCECRKPKIGLFLEAIKKWNLDVDRCIAIGDKERDLEICKNSKCKGFLLSKRDNGHISSLPYVFCETIVDVVELMGSNNE